jgi:glucokinase
MIVLAIDLGGTKLSSAVFMEDGTIVYKETTTLDHRAGKHVGGLITSLVKKSVLRQRRVGNVIDSIGIAVPGISRKKTGTVWAPNIRGWEDYPLLKEVTENVDGIPVNIDCDRACYILGEAWKGTAKGCKDAIYLAVGTGIGAGILSNGVIVNGAHDIAGAIGWMALDRPFHGKYSACGCFEYHASGEGLPRVAAEIIRSNKYVSELSSLTTITAYDIISACQKDDPVAIAVIEQAITFWGMAIANLVSLFNPEKIILGGGLFGPALQYIPDIKKEACLWAQPVSMGLVSIEPSALGTDAGLYGAAFLALQNLNSK